jgi:hypothetical protein
MRYQLLPSLIAGGAEATASGFPIAARADLFWPSHTEGMLFTPLLFAPLLFTSLLFAPLLFTLRLAKPHLWLDPGTF